MPDDLVNEVTLWKINHNMRMLLVILLLAAASRAAAQGIRITNSANAATAHVNTKDGIHNNFHLHSVAGKNAPTGIPSNLYTRSLPFFCRQELKMQQIHVPLILRIGTPDQCNYLEQKPGYK